MTHSRLAALVFGVSCVGPIIASELHVPSQFPLIQAAIDAAGDGDEIVIAPGSYSQSFNLRGKQIVVRGSGGADVTIVDGTGIDGSLVTANSGETFATVLEGITFQNGAGTLVSNCITSSGYVGGAVHLRFGALTVHDCVFYRNGDGAVHEMTAGGAIYAHVSDLALFDCQFHDNGYWESGQAGDGMHSGGGVYLCNGDLTIERCDFSGNGPVGHGGAVRFGSSGDIRVLDSQFTANNASHGAGLRISQSHAKALIQGCAFLQNTSSHGGGANITSNGLVQVEDCIFADNIAPFGAGLNITVDILGAIFPSRAEVKNCSFTDNRSGIGAGIFAQVGGDINEAYPKATLLVHNSHFQGNRAHNCCGVGIYSNECFTVGASTGQFVGGAASMGTYSGPHEIEIANCTAIDNDAKPGGAFHLFTCGGGGQIRVRNSTMFMNTPDALRIRLDAIPIMEIPTASIEVVNSILWGNGLVTNPEANISVDPLPGLTAGITYSNVQGGFAGVGNIDADPRYVDTVAGNFSLAPDSPCIDAGNNTLVAVDALDLDGDGDRSEPVPLDVFGADRFVDAPATPDTGVSDPANPHLAIVDMGALEFAPSACAGFECDANCDGSVNQFDIQPFIVAIQTHAACSECAGDTNGDGTVNQFDIEGFVSCLIP